MVVDGESIAFDASTTALAVARHLRRRGGWVHLTVITNGLRIAQELAGIPGITVAMPGGFVRWEALSVVGPLGDGLFRKVNVQKAFLGAAGFSLESGLSDATEEEAQIKRVDGRRRAAGHRHRRQHEMGPIGVRDVLPAGRSVGGHHRRRCAGSHGGRAARSRASTSTSLATQADDVAVDADAPDRAVTIAEARRRTGPRLARRRLDAVRRDPGARRRLARPPAAGGPRARRRERRRQEHAGQDPGRRPPARHAATILLDGEPVALHGPAQARAARHRRRPPGAAPVPRPDRRRERVPGPRPARRARHHRLGRDAARRPPRSSRVSASAWTPARSSAACRWPTSSSSRSPRRCRSRRAS